MKVNRLSSSVCLLCKEKRCSHEEEITDFKVRCPLLMGIQLLYKTMGFGIRLCLPIAV